jgi:hypothetical protein
VVYLIINRCFWPRISGTLKNSEEDIMKYRLNFKKLAAGIAIITSFLILGCDMTMEPLQDPLELYPEKGAVEINNISNTTSVKSVTVTYTDTTTNEKISRVLENSSFDDDIIKPRATLPVILDPGEYEFSVDYGSGTVSPPAETFEVIKGKRESWNITGESIRKDTGILQIINWSGNQVTSIKIDDIEILDGPILDQKSFSIQKVPGTYKVEVDVPEIGGPAFPATDEKVVIKQDTVTTIIVFQDGLEVGILDPAAYNLWILNRAKNPIKTVEKKKGALSYTPLPLSKSLPIAAIDGFAGTRLQPDAYTIRVTLDQETPNTVEHSVTLSNDPVFIIVKDGANGPEIEQITSGDRDEDGFPDWWEDLYFGPEAADDPNKPPKDGDEDNDGVNNWDEFENGTDPTKADTDGDGLWDGEEITGERNFDVTAEERPLGIQIPDTFEPTDPLKQDTDGDGYTDYLELVKGTDPNDAKDYPKNSSGITIIVNW